MYQGLNFIYDNIPSQLHNIVIASFDASTYRYQGGSSMEIITDKAPRSQKHHLLGTVPGDYLEFDLELVFTQGTKSPREVQIIKSWLCGQLSYKPLFIQHEDYEGVYFNCLINNPEEIYINGYNGLKVTVFCDAGGAWENPRTFSYAVDSNSRIVFSNDSDDNDYLYPTVSFTMGNLGGNCSITNTTDKNRQMTFASLQDRETITIVGNTGEIISSTGLNRLKNCNKNFLRLKPDLNILEFSGDIKSFSMTCQNFIRMGGG